MLDNHHLEKVIQQFALGRDGLRPAQYVVDAASRLIDGVLRQGAEYIDLGVVSDEDVYELYIRVRTAEGGLLEGTVEMPGRMQVGLYDEEMNVIRQGPVSWEGDVWALVHGDSEGLMLFGR